jgi:hypothetical protein
MWRTPCPFRRWKHTTLTDWRITVSQQDVERTIGKLATDEEFRMRFFTNPAAATWEALGGGWEVER